MNLDINFHILYNEVEMRSIYMSARRTARRGISRGKEAYAGSLFSRVSTKSIKKARGITMGRAKKDGRRVNFYMKTEVLDLLERYSDEVGQTKTEATERILKSSSQSVGTEDNVEDITKTMVGRRGPRALPAFRYPAIPPAAGGTAPFRARCIPKKLPQMKKRLESFP